MEKKRDTFFITTLPVITAVLLPLIIISFAATWYLGYRYINEQNIRYTNLEDRLGAQSMLMASTTDSLARSIQLIEENLTLAQVENSKLADALAAERERLASLQERTNQIGGTVGTLEKLSKTDEELLQKYSKVYFLNEHYVPSKLGEIKNQYLYSEDQTQFIHGEVLPFLTRMIEDAKNDGITLYVKSAYRSYNEQDHLKERYTITYGEGTANTFSADQGYSEHQLGTTVDFITTGIGGSLEKFGNTSAFAWLQNNAHRHGFILSYPQNNTHYIYEPWHWRFVGIDLATRLHNEGKNFYALDQRVIDEYLVSIFDTN